MLTQSLTHIHRISTRSTGSVRGCMCVCVCSRLAPGAAGAVREALGQGSGNQRRQSWHNLQLLTRSHGHSLSPVYVLPSTCQNIPVLLLSARPCWFLMKAGLATIFPGQSGLVSSLLYWFPPLYPIFCASSCRYKLLSCHSIISLPFISVM